MQQYKDEEYTWADYRIEVAVLEATGINFPSIENIAAIIATLPPQERKQEADLWAGWLRSAKTYVQRREVVKELQKFPKDFMYEVWKLV